MHHWQNQGVNFYYAARFDKHYFLFGVILLFVTVHQSLYLAMELPRAQPCFQTQLWRIFLNAMNLNKKNHQARYNYNNAPVITPHAHTLRITTRQNSHWPDMQVNTVSFHGLGLGNCLSSNKYTIMHHTDLQLHTKFAQTLYEFTDTYFLYCPEKFGLSNSEKSAIIQNLASYWTVHAHALSAFVDWYSVHI